MIALAKAVHELAQGRSIGVLAEQLTEQERAVLADMQSAVRRLSLNQDEALDGAGPMINWWSPVPLVLRSEIGPQINWWSPPPVVAVR
jgi:hypothetical protein